MIWRLSICSSLLFLGSAAFALEPSFDCSKAATPVEKLICSDEELSRLDAELQPAFKAAYKAIDSKQALLAGQRQWLSRRSFCASFDRGEDPAPRLACLRGRYVRRLAFLRRNHVLENAQVCHTLADTIASAKGYVGITHDAIVGGILELATNDALGAITLDLDGFSERGATKTPSAENLKLMAQIKKLDTGMTGYRRDYYRIGPESNQLAISSYTAGTAFCQTFHIYRVGRNDVLKEVTVTADRENDCRGDYTYFGAVPSNGKDESPVFAHVTRTMATDMISLDIWNGSIAKPVCRLTANYDVSLMLSGKACRDRSRCADLGKRAFDLAVAFDNTHRESTESVKAGETLASAKSVEMPGYEEPSLTVEKDWFRDGYDDEDQWQGFGVESSSYELAESKVLLRISHGYQFDFSNDGYIVEAYERTGDKPSPIAAFQINKIRSRLREPIEVNDRVSVMRKAR